MTNENVLVIKDNYIKENFSSFLTNGSKNILYPFNSNKSKEDIETLITQYSTFMPRDKVENDENYRQLIPYVVIKNKEEKIFIVKRTNKTTEKRLHNNYSLGMGGHINDQDKGSNNFQIFKNGMYREISEEIKGYLKEEEEEKNGKEDTKKTKSNNQLNPFLALFGAYNPKKENTSSPKTEIKKKYFLTPSEKKIENEIIMPQINQAIEEKTFTIFETYKKVHGMASFPK